MCSNTSSLKTIGSLLLGVTLLILYAQKCRFCKAPVEVVAEKVTIFFQNNVVSSILVINYHQYIKLAILVLILLYANYSKKCQGAANSLLHPVIIESCGQGIMYM